MTVPSPCPSLAEVIDTHDEGDEALHAHSRATPIEMVPVPPEGPKDEVEFVTVAWHRVFDGLVTLVFVELPHAADTASSAAAKGRARNAQVSTTEDIA